MLRISSSTFHRKPYSAAMSSLENTSGSVSVVITVRVSVRRPGTATWKRTSRKVSVSGIRAYSASDIHSGRAGRVQVTK